MQRAQQTISVGLDTCRACSKTDCQKCKAFNEDISYIEDILERVWALNGKWTGFNEVTV